MFGFNQGFGMNTPAPQQSPTILSFRAGRMHLSGGKVRADTRKGLLQLVMSDGLLHLQWRTRPNNVLEDDILLMPEEAKWEKVEEAADNATNSRVFVLKFQGSERLEFFWMQEPKEDKDEEYSDKINARLANPMGGGDEEFSTPAGQGTTPQQMMFGQGGMGALGGFGAGAHGGNPGHNNMMQMLQNMAGRAGGQGTPSGGGGGGGGNNGGAMLSPAFWQQTLRGMGGMGGLNQPARAHLSDILSGENLRPVFRDEEVIGDLIDYLPEGLQTPEEFTDMLHSSVFNAAVHQLHSLVNSRQLSQLLQSFDLDVPSMGGINEFLDALAAYGDAYNEEEEEDDEEDDNEDDGTEDKQDGMDTEEEE